MLKVVVHSQLRDRVTWSQARRRLLALAQSAVRHCGLAQQALAHLAHLNSLRRRQFVGRVENRTDIFEHLARPVEVLKRVMMPLKYRWVLTRLFGEADNEQTRCVDLFSQTVFEVARRRISGFGGRLREKLCAGAHRALDSIHACLSPLAMACRRALPGNP